MHYFVILSSVPFIPTFFCQFLSKSIVMHHVEPFIHELLEQQKKSLFCICSFPELFVGPQQRHFAKTPTLLSCMNCTLFWGELFVTWSNRKIFNICHQSLYLYKYKILSKKCFSRFPGKSGNFFPGNGKNNFPGIPGKLGNGNSREQALVFRAMQ